MNEGLGLGERAWVRAREGRGLVGQGIGLGKGWGEGLGLGEG